MDKRNRIYLDELVGGVRISESKNTRYRIRGHLKNWI